MAHRAEQVAPPQSTPVSSPFFTESEHVAAAHVLDARSHTRELQSSPEVQGLPTKHGEQSPPQSVWLSPPFFTPSEHVGAKHMDDAESQTPDEQSCSELHPAPAPHFDGQLPPQSSPVSSPFRALSTHEGAAQVHNPGSQTPDVH